MASFSGRTGGRRPIDAVWIPVTFVAFWSSGYLVGGIGTRAAPAFTLLFWRFLIALAVLGTIAVATRAPWPRGGRAWGHLLIAGVLLQTGQFAGVYLALARGTSAGLTALVASTSPLAISVLAVPLFGERLRSRQWWGLLVGLAGVGVAVAAELDGGGGVVGVLLAAAGVSSFVAGTLYQKRFGQEMDLRAGGTVQLIGATGTAAVATALGPGFALPLDAPSIGSVLFLAVVNSIAAFSFYFWLLRTRGGGAATSYLFLVPPATALLAVPILGEPLDVAALGGIALAAVGVAMVTWPSRDPGVPGGGDPATESRSTRWLPHRHQPSPPGRGDPATEPRSTSVATSPPPAIAPGRR